MRDRRDIDEITHRITFARSERARTIVAGVTGLAFLAGAAAVVTTALGAGLAFDAAPVAAPLGIAAGALVVAMFVGVDAWTQWRTWLAFRGRESVVDAPAPTPVPERDARVARERAAMVRRIEAQRAARSQRAASGGSVSSTDAGRPSQGSSEATTEP